MNSFPIEVFRHQPVNHQNNRRRDQDPERPPRSNRRRGQPVGITIAPHFRHRDLGHGGGRCQRGSADRGKPATGSNRRHCQTAAHVAQKGVGHGV